MSSKWASLNLEAGASPSTYRKASLLRSARNSVSSVTEAVTGPFKNEWGIATVIVIVAVIAILISYNKTKTTNLAARLQARAPTSTTGPSTGTAAGTATGTTSGPDVGTIVQAEAVPEVPTVPGNVEPKFALTDRFFGATEGPSDQFLNNSSFNDFQSAFFGKNEKPVIEANASSDFVESFVGLADYVKNHDVPESLLSASASRSIELPSVFGGNVNISDSEARTLAAEAFQVVPNGSNELIVSTLREILAAYTEASKVGLALPQSPDEQLSALKTLSRRSGQAGELAKNILSRIN
jgi:hypothetical protein